MMTEKAKSTINKTIQYLGEKSCLTNILNEFGMGPGVYHIVNPSSQSTKVFVHRTFDKEFQSNYFERSLNKLLDYLEDEIQKGNLQKTPFNSFECQEYSEAFDVELDISDVLSKRLASLSQTWITKK